MKATEEYAGLVMNCPKCGKSFKVPPLEEVERIGQPAPQPAKKQSAAAVIQSARTAPPTSRSKPATKPVAPPQPAAPKPVAKQPQPSKPPTRPAAAPSQPAAKSAPSKPALAPNKPAAPTKAPAPAKPSAPAAPAKPEPAPVPDLDPLADFGDLPGSDTGLDDLGDLPDFGSGLGEMTEELTDASAQEPATIETTATAEPEIEEAVEEPEPEAPVAAKKSKSKAKQPRAPRSTPAWMATPAIDALLTTAAVVLAVVAFATARPALLVDPQVTVQAGSGAAAGGATVQLDGETIRLNQNEVPSPEALEAQLRAARPAQLLVEVDGDVLYGTVSRVVAAAGRVGIGKVQVAVRQQ